MDSPPNVLYQYVNIVPNINQDSIEAETILWIGYKDSIAVGSTIYLHCRQCKIREVYVNNISTSYILNDALKSLAYDININNKKQSFLSEELDINYRAALELTRRGELEIIIPDEILNGTLNTPKPIPRSSPKDVIIRYEKLLKIYNMLQSQSNIPSSSSKHTSNRNQFSSSNQSPSNLSDNGSMDSSQMSENEGKVRTNFIQIRIIYELNSKDISTGETKSRNNSGYVFRHKPQLVELFEATLRKKRNSNISKNKFLPSTLESIYTTVNSCGTLRDVDGIRCWLPCVDALDQRAVYDISITMPMNWKVSCCGKKLSTYLIPQDNNNNDTAINQENLTVPLKISRFFTSNRIPAMSVGFFIGRIESYTMPLYKVKSRIWVVKGLNDFESNAKFKSKKERTKTCDVIKNEMISDNTTDEEAYTNDDDDDIEEEKEDNMVLVKKLDGDYYASYKRRLNAIDTSNESVTINNIISNKEQTMVVNQESPPLKKIRTLSKDMKDSSRKIYKMEAPNVKINNTNIQSSQTRKDNKSKVLYSKTSKSSELYQEQVHHSTLGLDMALRLIHKFANLKYDYDEYTLIFVYDLGKDFMSFDGFALIDAKYLHNSQQVYLETTTHFVLIEAYLYSWIKSSLPICSYEVEFIIHGTVGYLLNFYSEEVYGEEDGKYRYQKIYDTVIRLEMQGRGYPLSSFYPESFEVFNPYYALYLKSKSTVIFHLIENRIGGKDPMRITLKHIIHSPPLHNSSQRHIKGTNIEVINNFQSLLNTSGISVSNAVTPPSPSMIASMLNEQYKQRQRSNSDEMSSNYSQAMSPYTMLGSGTPYSTSGNLSPYISKDMLPYLYSNQNENLSPYLKQGNISPYLKQGNMSPYSTAYGNMSPYYQQYGNMSPYAAAAAYAGGSYTPAPYYDPYAVHSTGAVYVNSSFNPDRYEITHSPVIKAVEASNDTENEVNLNESKQLDVVIDSYEIETNVVNEENIEKLTSANVTSAAVSESNSTIMITTVVNESGISAMGGGYYATLARRDEKIRSNSITIDPANPTTIAATATSRSRSNSISGGPHVSEEHLIEKSAVKSSLNRQLSQTSETSIAGNSEQIVNLLTTDCISADSFILTVKHASGASADIDNSFLDKYVYKSGVLFLRIHVSISPKVDTKPRHIFVISQQVGMKQGGEIDNAYANEEIIKLRIAEARDDFVTEPMIRFFDISEQYQQQAYSRPGRRAGFRRTKAEDTSNMTIEEITELTRKEKILEERKSALQRVRDIDYAIKYVVLDPSCLDIADVCNSSSDLLLIEQLYTDFYEHSVYFQCQALRSLARSAPSNELIYIENKVESHTDSTATTSSSNPKLNSSIPEKSAKLQIKAFCDCLLGLSTKIQDIKCLDGTQFCIYVRAEAAFALAQWQNENAPRSIVMDLTSSETHWLGMKALINILYELFIEAKTNVPLPSDFSNETFTYLRNAIILALSTIKAQSGVTPLEVVETILLFNSTIEEDIATNTSDQINKIKLKYDDTHYRTIVFHALSNLRFDSITNISNTITNSSIDKTNQIDFVHPIYKIISVAKTIINTAFTQARAIARIKYRKHQTNFLPYLPGNGIDVAAAISCLAEMDIQAIEMMISGRSINTLDPRELEKPHPTGVGILTKFDYLKYVFPPETELKCAPRFLSPYYIPKDKNLLKDKLSFSLCTPVVRAAAFEAFVRICFALQYGYIERLKSIHAKESLKASNIDGVTNTTNVKTSNLKVSDSTYMAATIEALLEILKQEGNIWLKQQAAIIISDTIMDRPARITIQSISNNNHWYCFGNYWSDPHGLTITSHSIQHLLKPNTTITNSKDKSIWKVGNGRKAMLSTGSNFKMAIKLYWRFIMMSANFDQTIRSVLAHAWIYAFGTDVPRIIKETNDELKQFSDNFFHNQLTEDRLTIRNPIEITNLVNKSLKYGIIISKDNDNDNPDITNTINVDTIESMTVGTTTNTMNSIVTSSNTTSTIVNKHSVKQINNKSNDIQSLSSDQIINKELTDNNINIIKSPLKLTFTLNNHKSTINLSNNTNPINTATINNNTTATNQSIDNKQANKPLGDKKTFRFVL